MDEDVAVHVMLVPEILVVGALAAVLGASLLGWVTVFPSLSRPARLAAFGFALVETLIPLGVYLDLRRRTDDPDRAWVHAATLPIVNVFGVIAYLEDRKRTGE